MLITRLLIGCHRHLYPRNVAIIAAQQLLPQGHDEPTIQWINRHGRHNVGGLYGAIHICEGAWLPHTIRVPRVPKVWGAKETEEPTFL